MGDGESADRHRAGGWDVIYLSPRGCSQFTPDRFGVFVSIGHNKWSGGTTLLDNSFLWAMDNGQFTGKATLDDFMDALKYVSRWKRTCLFIVAPDVIGDAKKTIEHYPAWSDAIRSFGYPVAFAGQDGLEHYSFPDDFNAFFIGGSTRWKLSKQAREFAQEAKRRGKWVHMGRVNSLARIHYAKSIGCDSVDGTHIIFEPRRASLRLTAWMNQAPLFYGGYA